MLQIGLSVEVLSLYIADSFQVGALEEDHVSWEKLVTHSFNNHSNLDSLPGHWLKQFSLVVVD